MDIELLERFTYSYDNYCELGPRMDIRRNYMGIMMSSPLAEELGVGHQCSELLLRKMVLTYKHDLRNRPLMPSSWNEPKYTFHLDGYTFTVQYNSTARVCRLRCIERLYYFQFAPLNTFQENCRFYKTNTGLLPIFDLDIFQRYVNPKLWT